jgi:hypothetical protein
LSNDAAHLKWTLRKLGFSDTAINAAWPGWWTDAAAESASANTDLRFSLARKLGLDPRSLLDDEQPRFVWKDEAKFKRLTGESNFDRDALTSFGASLARALISGSQAGQPIVDVSAAALRESILSTQQFVRLVDLLGLCWAVGIPVIHLRVFPLTAKRMCAMAVRADGRHAILLGKDADYPAPIAYYLAHEIGHIALGHLSDTVAVVDLQDPLEQRDATDEEEQAADKYALELLTGNSEISVATETKHFNASQLAHNLLNTAQSARIEPGTLALCYGYSTNDWAKAQAAMKLIYVAKQPVWREVNNVALKQIEWTNISNDFALFMHAVMGGISNASRGN